MYRFIEGEKDQQPVSMQCKTLGVSRSGYYACQRRGESARAQTDHRWRVLIREAYEAGRGAYGSPRVHRELKNQGHRIGRKKVIRLMRLDGLRGKVRKRWTRTTDSNHALPVAPNRLARQFVATAPNQRWVGDITYLRAPEGFLYLAVILDLYSRRVVGWAVSSRIDRHLVLKAFTMAVLHRSPNAGLLHHTDRGSQYASEDYQRALEDRGAICSMSGRGDCYDNAVAESWFATLKTELGESFFSDEDAETKLFDYIEVFYNQKRLHSALDYQSPAQYERSASMELAA